MKNNEEFKPLPYLLELFLKKEDLPEYYRAKRKYLYEHGKALKGMKIKKSFHNVILDLMTLNRKYIDRQTLKILKDEHVETGKNVIYVVTHIGKFDYQLVSEAIKKHQIPFAGDPETMYRTFDGAILNLNGVIYCDTDDKTDRKTAAATAVQALNENYNLLIYSEGVWNITPNLLMLPIFPGAIRMAKETGCEIIPVAIEQYESHFIVNIGKNYKVANIDFNDEFLNDMYIDYKRLELRDIMAALKWEIFESLSINERKNMGDYEEKRKEMVDTRLNEWYNKKEDKPYYSEEKIEERTYKEKKNYYDYLKEMEYAKKTLEKNIDTCEEIEKLTKERLEEYKRSGR